MNNKADEINSVKEATVLPSSDNFLIEQMKVKSSELIILCILKTKINIS